LRPALAIDTTSDSSPHGANVPTLESDSAPSTSNPINRPNERHSRRVQWATNTTSVTAPQDALRVHQEDNALRRLSSLDELALDVCRFGYFIHFFY
jgi:hypothetical protein